MSGKDLVTSVFGVLKAPFALYFELTIAEPYREITEPSAGRALPVLHPKLQSDDHHFSFFELLFKQRRAVSPNTNQDMVCVHSVRDHYVRQKPLPESPRWIH